MTIPTIGCLPRIAGGEGNHWVVCTTHEWEDGPHYHRREAAAARRDHRREAAARKR